MWDIEIARQHGAKIYQGEDGLWIIMDMKNTCLWWAYFHTEEDASRAFLSWEKEFEKGNCVTDIIYNAKTGKYRTVPHKRVVGDSEIVNYQTYKNADGRVTIMHRENNLLWYPTHMWGDLS